MRISVKEVLNVNKYKFYYKFSQKEGVLFLNEYIKKVSIVSILYYLSVIINLLIVLLYTLAKPTSFDFFMGDFGMAILVFIPAIISHELLHALVIIILGGRNLKFGFEHGLIYTKLCNFVITNTEYAILAITPLLVLTILSWVFILTGSDNLRIGIIFILFNLWGSYGDVAIVNFCWLNRKKNIYGYSSEDGFSYFYTKQ